MLNQGPAPITPSFESKKKNIKYTLQELRAIGNHCKDLPCPAVLEIPPLDVLNRSYTPK